MNKFKLVFSIFVLFIFNNKISTIIYENPLKAICIAPVVDLINESIESNNNNVKAEDEYSKIPFSPELEHLFCLRVHQAIFNEVVDIIEETDEEVKIQINTVFYKIERSGFKKNYYWALKDKFKKIDQLEKDKINLTFFPEPIDCNKTDFNQKPKQNIVTLKLPFYDHLTHKIYSAGTRFVFKEKSNQDYTLYIYDSLINKVVEVKISKEICLEFQENNQTQKIENFINLLKLWSNLNNKVIPYVWGGCSMQQLSHHNNFKLVCNYDNQGNRANFYTRNDQFETPYSGFDCSGLIVRAAQICQIPYFFKNSFTIVKYLKSLEENEDIEAGDLIWFPGHVIVISDVKNNLCIEARGYKSGHGKIHEIALSKLFHDIENFDQLKEFHLKNMQIELINKYGNVTAILEEFKIIKLKSLWQ